MIAKQMVDTTNNVFNVIEVDKLRKKKKKWTLLIHPKTFLLNKQKSFTFNKDLLLYQERKKKCLTFQSWKIDFLSKADSTYKQYY